MLTIRNLLVDYFESGALNLKFSGNGNFVVEDRGELSQVQEITKALFIDLVLTNLCSARLISEDRRCVVQRKMQNNSARKSHDEDKIACYNCPSTTFGQ